jgi:hypothetical protein
MSNVLQLTLRPVIITVKSIRALAESNELSASDEVYVIVLAVDLAATPPNARAILTGAWGNVDTGESHPAIQFPANTTEEVFDNMAKLGVVVARPFWGLNGRPSVIKHQNDVLFLVACMEHDNGKPEAARVLVQSVATATLAASLGLPRSTIVQNLRRDIDSALKTPTGFPDADNQIGITKELRLTPTHVVNAVLPNSFEESLYFSGGSQGEGHIRVDILFRPQAA